MKFNAYDISARNILKTFGTFFIKSEQIKLDNITPADGQIISRQSGIWVNVADPSLNPYTSFVLNPTSKKLETYKGITKVEDLDFPALFVTDTELATILEDYLTENANQVPWKIHLNSGGVDGSVATRISGLIEGTDYPTGWSLSVGSTATSLVVTHGLGRDIAEVNVFYIDSGDGNKKKKIKGDLAYVNLEDASDSDSFEIGSLSTKTFELNVHLFFSI